MFKEIIFDTVNSPTLSLMNNVIQSEQVALPTVYEYFQHRCVALGQNDKSRLFKY